MIYSSNPKTTLAIISKKSATQTAATIIKNIPNIFGSFDVKPGTGVVGKLCSLWRNITSYSQDGQIVFGFHLWLSHIVSNLWSRNFKGEPSWT